MRYLYIVFWFLIYGFWVHGQETCFNGIMDGVELKTDCGGDSGCPTCISLLYEGAYNAEDYLELQVGLPEYIGTEEEAEEGYYYTFEGFVEDECTYWADCQFFVIVPGTYDVVIVVKKFNPENEVVGYGELIVKALCGSCLPPSQDKICPPESQFSASATSFPSKNPSHFMINLEISEGIPPYRIFDLDANRFYDDEIYTETYNLGIIPNEKVLNLMIFDSRDCEYRLDSIHQFTQPEITTNLPDIKNTFEAKILTQNQKNTLEISSNYPQNIKISIINMMGQTVYLSQNMEVQGTQLLNLPKTTGMNLVVIENSGERQVLKVAF